jgi:hypothetical protein
MKPDEQRIKIAEACGWTEVFPTTINKTIIGTRHDGLHDTEIPDYLNDLNACHEMEKVLDWTQTCLMRNYLDEIVERPHTYNGGVDMSKARIWQATAAQRAEAFLKTLNLWTNP